MNPVRMISWALVTLLLAAGATAQEMVRFDPTIHLPGFEETRSSEVKDLFPIDAYSDLLGNEMDPKQLAEVQAKWKAESAEIQAHIDEVRTNPTAGMRWMLEKRMSQHKFFSKVTLTLDVSVPPFMIFVQKPSFEDPNYATSIVQLFAPYLTKVAAVFDERIAKPTGATRKPNRPLTPIVILASPGDFDNYYRLGGPRESLTSGADYDPKLDVVIVAVNSFEKPKPTPPVLHPLLRESFISIMNAHAKPPAKAVSSLWLREGMASASTWPRAGKVEALGEAEPRVEDFKLLVELCHKAGDARLTNLHPLSVLSSMTSWSAVHNYAFGARPYQQAAYTQLWQAYLAQSSLWMRYLLYAHGGKHRAKFEAYLKMAMNGQAGTDSLSFAFVGTKLADLDKEFWAWIYDEHQRLLPKTEIDRNDLNGLFEALPKPGENDELVRRAKESLKEPPFDPATLVIAESDVESRHGLALQRARSGDFEAARTMLEALAATKPSQPEEGRIARDIQRMGAAVALRDGLLAALIAKNARLSVEVKGKKINAPVAKVEGGQIVFGENTHGAKTLALTALDPLDVARQAEKKELQGDAPPWARPWLYLLCGDARWEKLLKTDSTEAREIKEDGAVWYRDRMKSGLAASTIEKLSKLPVPTSRAEAVPIVDDVRELMKSYADTVSVFAKKNALASCARSALMVMQSEGDGSEFVHGKFTKDADGLVTLTYDWSSTEEALDFQHHKGHLAQWRKTFPAGDLPEEKATRVLKENALHLLGNAVWRLPIGFAAPITLRAECSLTTEEGKILPAPNIGFAICDVPPENFIYIGCYGRILVEDSEGNTVSGESPPMYTPGRKYSLEVVHDGRHVKTKLDGADVGKAEVGSLRGGAVEIIAACASPTLVHRLEITGKVDAASLLAARSAWVARTLVEMGF